MHIRVRKFVGTLILIPFVILYSVIVMMLAVAILPESNGWIQLLFYIVGGFAWVPPSALLIKWMVKPEPDRLPEPSRQQSSA